MHPDDIPSKYPGEHKHVNHAESETIEANPRKAGKSFENRVVKLYSSSCPPREESSDETEYVNYLHAQYALPAV
jgi:hypothetical protein